MTMKEIFDAVKKEQFLDLGDSDWCKLTKEELSQLYDRQIEAGTSWFIDIPMIRGIKYNED